MVLRTTTKDEHVVCARPTFPARYNPRTPTNTPPRRVLRRCHARLGRGSRRVCHDRPMATTLEETRLEWLRRLPSLIAQFTTRWSLTVASPFLSIDAGCAWVAPATDQSGRDAVLKVSFPHFEEELDIRGLRFWDGEPTVQLLAADDELHVMLLERCVPRTAL
jgi:hypothetical protein